MMPVYTCLCSALVLFFCLHASPVSAQANAPAWQWAQKVGGNGGQDYAGTVAAGKSGNVYVAGFFNGTGTFGNLTLTSPGLGTGYVAKYRPNGTSIWALPVAVASVRDIAVDAQENWYITGTFSGTTIIGTDTLVSQDGEDMYLAKFDSAGQYAWVRHARGNSQNIGNAVAVDAQGNCYVTGYNFGTAFFGATQVSSRTYLAKYTAAGQLQWVKTNNALEGWDVATDRFGNSFITGSFTYQVNFGSLVSLQGSQEPHMYVAKYDSAGTALWARGTLGTGQASGAQVKADNAGNCLVLADIADSVNFDTSVLLVGDSWDGVILKYDATGNLNWFKQTGSSGWDMANGLAVDSAGNSYVTGQFDDNVAFGSHFLSSSGDWDIFVFKIDPAGQINWAKKAGGITSDKGFGIAVDAAGNCYAAGQTAYNPSFGSISVSTISSGFLAKIASGVVSAPEFESRQTLQAWPNPFSQQFYILPLTAGHAPVNVQVTDLLGREVYSATLQVSSQNKTPILLNIPGSVSAGVYVLYCRQGPVTQQLKLIKK